MEQETSDKLFRVLSKDVLKENLAKAGLYTLAYESLLHSIVHRPKKFLTMAGTVADEEYKAEVIALYPQSEFIASCLWLQKHGVLTAEDVKEIRAIRKHRTDIAHEPINVLLDTENQVDETKLMTIYQLLARIDQWWISEFEIPANPDFDGQEIDPGGLQSGSMILLKYLISVVCDKDVNAPINAE